MLTNREADFATVQLVNIGQYYRLKSFGKFYLFDNDLKCIGYQNDVKFTPCDTSAVRVYSIYSYEFEKIINGLMLNEMFKTSLDLVYGNLMKRWKWPADVRFFYKIE